MLRTIKAKHLINMQHEFMFYTNDGKNEVTHFYRGFNEHTIYSSCDMLDYEDDIQVDEDEYRNHLIDLICSVVDGVYEIEKFGDSVTVNFVYWSEDRTFSTPIDIEPWNDKYKIEVKR